MTPALQRLKLGTADMHLQAERHVRILDPDATDATYARYLTKMYGFHLPLEHAFAQHAALTAAGFAPQQRIKRHWIAEDLGALGIDARSIEPCPQPPVLGDVMRAVGVAYVIEGSTLGGRFILAKLRSNLPHLEGRATRFLAGYGDDTGARWRQFGTIAERILFDDAAVDRAIDGACDTFSRLIDWLDEPAADPPYPRRLKVSA